MTTFLLLAVVTDVWAGLSTHPAVVNPVSYETFGRPATVVSILAAKECADGRREALKR